MQRILCLITGYLCGSFLTAEVVAYVKVRKSAKEIGTGNPGMANIMQQLGFKSGILVLAGDLGKTVLAILLCHILCPSIGIAATLYGGLGAILGHNFPLWNRFYGGKGVAVTCMFLVCLDPVWGLASCIGGMLIVFFSCSLTLGAIAIPAIFLIPACLFYGFEARIIAVLSCLIMFSEHFSALCQVIRGEGVKVDVLSKIMQLVHRRDSV